MPAPLTIDLLRSVVPISKAASALAALIRQAEQSGAPVVITQKGYPSAVLLSAAEFERLRAAAEAGAGGEAGE